MTKYFDCFKSVQVDAELSKRNLTKHEELEKAERGDENTNNPEKVEEKKSLSMAFLGLADPKR